MGFLRCFVICCLLSAVRSSAPSPRTGTLLVLIVSYLIIRQELVTAVGDASVCLSTTTDPNKLSLRPLQLLASTARLALPVRRSCSTFGLSYGSTQCNQVPWLLAPLTFAFRFGWPGSKQWWHTNSSFAIHHRQKALALVNQRQHDLLEAFTRCIKLVEGQ